MTWSVVCYFFELWIKVPKMKIDMKSRVAAHDRYDEWIGRVVNEREHFVALVAFQVLLGVPPKCQPIVASIMETSWILGIRSRLVRRIDDLLVVDEERRI